MTVTLLLVTTTPLLEFPGPLSRSNVERSNFLFLGSILTTRPSISLVSSEHHVTVKSGDCKVWTFKEIFLESEDDHEGHFSDKGTFYWTVSLSYLCRSWASHRHILRLPLLGSGHFSESYSAHFTLGVQTFPSQTRLDLSHQTISLNTVTNSSYQVHHTKIINF